MEAIRIVIPGVPVGKARARSNILMRNGKPVMGAGGRPIMTHHTPEKTENYEALVKYAGHQAMNGNPPTDQAVAIDLQLFVVPPASWSQKKRRDALEDRIRPTTKPDADNVLKAIADGLNGIVWADDKQMTDVIIRKRYAETPRAILYVRPALAVPSAPDTQEQKGLWHGSENPR